MSLLKNLYKIKLKLCFGAQSVHLCSSSTFFGVDSFKYKPEYKKYEKEWLEIENNRRKKLIILPDNPKEDLKIKYPLRIGGTDVSYKNDPGHRDRQTEAFACYVVLEYFDKFQKEPCVIYEDYLKYIPDVPFVPGFLGIREAEPLTRLIRRQMKCFPKLTPHCVMVDGNGLLHIRKFGIACHIGVLTYLPTIGISKEYWRYPPSEQTCAAKEIRIAQKNKGNELKKAGDFSEISHPDNPEDIVGIALKTVDSIYTPDCSGGWKKPNDYYKYLLSLKEPAFTSKKSIYISIGHKISLLKSKELVLRTKTSMSIFPEATRLADSLSRKSIKGIHDDGFLRPNILAVNYNELGIPIINNKTNKSL